MAKTFRKPELSYVINERIRVNEVRVTGNDIESEVLSTIDALKLAESKGLDLILINSKSSPAICKVGDYSKFLYEAKKKLKDQASNTKKIVVKEIRLTPNTDTNDFNTKTKQAIKFLDKGNRLKVTLQFRGREMTHKERGEIMLFNLAQELGEVGVVEVMPKLDGRKMFMTVKPKK
jgi:translation initiation factor IF-3|tara:strand:- start:277 stop:804 length:528 start_codon:yes stop_codon:yes gene_type:complete